MDISRNVSRAAQAMGIRGYVDKVVKCACGTPSNVLWFSHFFNEEVVACTWECANQPPPKRKKGTTNASQR